MFRLPLCAICIVAFSFLWTSDAARIKRGQADAAPQTIIPENPDIRARFPDGYTTKMEHGPTVYSGSTAYFRAHTGKHLTVDPMAHGVNAQVTGHGDEQKFEIVKLRDTSWWEKIGYETLQVGDHISLWKDTSSSWFDDSSKGDYLDVADGTVKTAPRHYGDSQKFVIEAAESRDLSQGTGFTFGQQIRLKALPALVQLTNGECRTAAGGPGTFDTISADCSSCKRHCLNTTSCVAAECQPSGTSCKLHKDPITQTETIEDLITQSECWTKQAGKYLEVNGTEVHAKSAKKDSSQVFVIERYSGIGGLYSPDLPEHGPLGSRLETLNHLGNAAIAVYNANNETGKMHWRHGWQPIHYQLEFSKGWASWSRANVQAGVFKHHDFPEVAIVSFRGTQSTRSVLQDLKFSWGGPQAASIDA